MRTRDRSDALVASAVGSMAATVTLLIASSHIPPGGFVAAVTLAGSAAVVLSYRTARGPFLEQLRRKRMGLDTSVKPVDTRTLREKMTEFGRNILTWLAAKLPSKEGISPMRVRLEGAGLSFSPPEWMAMRTMLTLAGGGFSALAMGPIQAVFVTIACWMVPDLWLGGRASARAQRFEEHLPNTLSQMCSALRSGLSIQQAMGAVAQDSKGPVSEEFARCLIELRIGTPFDEVLERMALRIKCRALDATVTAILVNREAGGNLAEVIDRVAESVRMRLEVSVEAKALTAQARSSAWIVGAIPIVLGGGMATFNPDYFNMFMVHPLGLVLFGVAVALWLLGVGTVIMLAKNGAR